MNVAYLKQHVNNACLEDAPTARFVQIEKELSACKAEDTPPYVRNIKAAFLSSFTITSLPEVVRARGLLHNLLIETYLAPYNQSTQELLSQDTGIHTFQPDCIFLLLDAPDILDTEHLSSLVEAASQIASAVVVANFAKSPSVESERVTLLNQHLSSLKEKHNLFIFDLQNFISRQTDAWYTKYVELGDLRISPHRFPEWAEQLLAPLVAHTGATRKCIVTDLDNTLWKGVVGECGTTGVKCNLPYESWLLKHYDKGVILAISSKNNEEDALEVFRSDRTTLTEDHFAAWEINWNPKDRNIVALAEELNIGTDSLVFVDDDPLQQRLVIDSLPEVAVLSPENYLDFVGFTKSSITEEDRRKGKMYAEERKRKAFKRTALSEAEFLAKLEMKMHIRRPIDTDVPRLSQLTQKTNQYNLTTRRLHEHEVVDYIEGDTTDILLFEMNDTFGEYGVVGACFLEYLENTCHIDNFMMSCRVIGRNAERAFLGHIISHAQNQGLHTITGIYIQSAKNQIARSFFSKHGFKAEITTQGEKWSLSTTKNFSSPTYIRIIGE